MISHITIGTRGSKLALIQTQRVSQQLQELAADLEIKIEQIRTQGDRITDAPLTQIGGDGVFVTEIERALEQRRIDLAIHSLKDLPTAQPSGLTVLVSGPREDVRDVLIARPTFLSERGIANILEVLEQDGGSGIRIGTCSLRRMAQLHARAPQAEVLSLRGNVDTRLRKLDAGDYDLIVLAAAGLHRMELVERLQDRLVYLPLDWMLPAPGQGALGLETRIDSEIQELLAPMRDPIAQATTTAERAFMRCLGAGCYLPVAAHAVYTDEQLVLSGLVISLDGQTQVRVRQAFPWTPTSVASSVPEELGQAAATQALNQGAAAIIHEIRVLAAL